MAAPPPSMPTGSTSNTIASPPGLMFKLSLMMFLQFFIWGAWFEIGFSYIPGLKFPEWWMNGLVFGAFNIGALVALFFSTQLADRKFAAEKFVAFSHFVGGAAMIGLFSLPEPVEFWPFFGLMLLHSVFYVPTISITNSIAFASFTNPEKQFGPVRLWGTIGWIVASRPFIFILVDWNLVNQSGKTGLDWLGQALATPLTGVAGQIAKGYAFLVAGIASLVLAAFSLTLPHTPPKPAAAGDSLAWVKALKLLKHPFILALFIVTFIDAAVHQSYFFWTFDFLAGPVGIPANWAGAVMKIGQLAEILTMLSLGWVLKSFGWRTTMIIGVLGHAVRFGVFAFFPGQVPVIAVILLHGVCYAFFFATVYIFVDKYFPKDVRSSAQGLFNVLILGVGPFVANFACGQLAKSYKIGDQIQYPAVFEYSMFAAILGAILLALFFHPPKDEVKG
jgi:MFS family permease